MTLKLYAHPFSSYCQKALTALYENGTPFDYRRLDEPGAMDELAARWPIRRFPVLVDEGRTIAEATVIIEHLGLHHPGPVQLLPDDPRAALFRDALDMTTQLDFLREQRVAGAPVFDALVRIVPAIALRQFGGRHERRCRRHRDLPFN